MAEQLAPTPMRFPMTLVHGGCALLLSAAAGAAAGDHSITVAVITASAGVAGVVLGPIITETIRDRRERRRRPPIDHHAELGTESNALVAHLLNELEEKDAEIAKLRRRRRAP